MREKMVFLVVLLVIFAAGSTNAGTNSMNVGQFETAMTNLHHDDLRLSRNGAYALGELGDVRAVEPLASALKSDDLHLRRIAAHALGKIGDQEAVMPLIEILCSLEEHVEVQMAAVKALGKIGDYRAARILAHLANQEKSRLQLEAGNALKSLSPMLYAAYTAK